MTLENIGFESEKKIERKSYGGEAYLGKDRWGSYYLQLEKIRECANKLSPKNRKLKILEIGKGNGIISYVLELDGFDVTTWDINEKLNPTYVLNLCDVKLDEIDEQYDIVLCAEVLEHIQFCDFEECVKKLSHISSDFFIITLPNVQKYWTIRITIPKFKIHFVIPKPLKRYKILPPHFWELNSEKQTDITNIRKIISSFGKIIDEEPCKDNLYHYYFVCQK